MAKISHRWIVGEGKMPIELKKAIEAEWYGFVDLNGDLWLQHLDPEKPMAALCPFGTEVGLAKNDTLVLEGKPIIPD